MFSETTEGRCLQSCLLPSPAFVTLPGVSAGMIDADNTRRMGGGGKHEEALFSLAWSPGQMPFDF